MSKSDDSEKSKANAAMYTAVSQPPAMREGGNLADNWREWKKTFDWYLIASGRENSSNREKCALLLHTIGKTGRDLFEEFDISTSEQNNYDTLCKKFNDRCDPQKNTNFERHLFFESYQVNDDFDKYLASLRVKSKSCDFGGLRESLILTQMIRGIKDGQLRERMLRKRDLKLEEAVSWCRAAEVASEQAGAVRSGVGASAAAGSTGAPAAPSAVIDQMHARSWARAPPRSSTAAGVRPGARPQRPMQPRQRDAGGAGDRFKCSNCDYVHVRNKCPAFNIKCFRCNRSGHFMRCCKNNYIREVCYTSDEMSELEELTIQGVEINSLESRGWFETVEVNGVPVSFKLDSGADACVMSYDSFIAAGFGEHMLNDTGTVLREVSKNVLPVMGYFTGKMFHSSNKNKCTCKIYVLNIQCNNLLSRDVCMELNLIMRINEISNQINCSNLIDKYKTVFEGIGRLPGEHRLIVDETVSPTVRSSRKIPIKLRPRLREELDRLQELNIIEKVDEPTDWVSSIVLVEKPDGKLRLCIDPQHLNKAIKRSHFQLPTLDEITANLSGAKYFSHLDASKGFYMIALDEDSSKLCTFATPFGRYKFLRLPFGICSASEVFHNAMVKIFAREGVECFVDDLLVYGRTKEEHDARLEAVLQRALKHGVRFNKEKCVLGVAQVKYLGHILDATGIRPDADRVKAIKGMPPPRCRKELERFLGMTNYVSRFITNYAELVEPMRGLMKRNVNFEWNESHTKVYNKIKKCLIEAPTLRYYDPNEPVVVSVDASSRGLGACLLQRGRPVAFAARTLTPAETRWAQIEKELLAIVFGCFKFHQFIYGHKSVLVESDHKPLEAIFKKALNDTPVRLQRMLLRLQKYSLEIKYVPGRFMFVADTLSRAPTDSGCDQQIGDEVDVHVSALYNNVNFSADKLKLIKEEIDKDPGLSAVRDYCRSGWPHTKNLLRGEVKPFWAMRDELHVINGIVFRINRVVIPCSLRKEMLQRIHEGHLGIEKCKYRARDVMWWPGMSGQVETLVAACSACAERRAAQPRQPLLPHAAPARPWEMLGADLFQIKNKYYLLVVDYYSKYVEVVSLADIRSGTIISQMKGIFARHGIPKKLVSDNGLQFTSAEFTSFVNTWEFEHVTSSPYYARSNGLAERNIQTIKKLMMKAESDGSDPYLALLNFRNTPVTSDTYSPAQLLMGRRLNTRLPVSDKLLVPKVPVQGIVLKSRDIKRQKSKQYYDARTRPLRPLEKNEQVRIREPNPNREARWVPARIESAAPQPRSYWVSTPDGARYRRNRQHIISSPHTAHTRNSTQSRTPTKPFITSSHLTQSKLPTESNNQTNYKDYDDFVDNGNDTNNRNTQTSEHNTNNEGVGKYYVTRSGRQVRPPIQWGY